MTHTPQGLSRFVLLWLAQTLSTIGTQLTGFGLGVWVYQHTQSTLLYSLTALANFAPRVLVTPLLGGMVDRHDLRYVLLLGHGGAGVCSLLIALLFATDRPHLGLIIGLVVVGASFNSVHLPAFPKAMTLLVEKRHLPRANGLLQLGMALGFIVAPLLASMLMPAIGLVGILAIDFSMGLFGLTIVATMRGGLRAPPATPAPGALGERSAWRDALFGWRYITQHPGLLGLQLIITAMSFNLGILQVLITPLMLSFADVQVLGIVMFTGGMGMLAGSVAMMTWGGPQRRVVGILVFLLLQGAFMLTGSLRASAVLVGVGAFGVLFTIPIITACNQTLWQRKIPVELQGRIFGVHHAISGASVPLAYLLAGPLTDLLLEPLMASTGPLAGSVGLLLGTGRGRGIAFLFALLGVASFLLALVSALSPSVRHVEEPVEEALAEARTAP